MPKKSSMASVVVPWGIRTGTVGALTGSGAVGSVKGAYMPVIVWASRSTFAEDEARRQLPWTVEVEGVMIVKKANGVRAGGVARASARIYSRRSPRPKKQSSWRVARGPNVDPQENAINSKT